MRRSIGIVVALLVAVGIIGVVFANSHNTEKSGVQSSIVTTSASPETSQAPQNLAISGSPEPCLMALLGIGGLIYVTGKKRRQHRQRSA